MVECPERTDLSYESFANNLAANPESSLFYLNLDHIQFYSFRKYLRMGSSLFSGRVHSKVQGTCRAYKEEKRFRKFNNEG